jgi:hypothetical protein
MGGRGGRKRGRLLTVDHVHELGECLNKNVSIQL